MTRRKSNHDHLLFIVDLAFSKIILNKINYKLKLEMRHLHGCLFAFVASHAFLYMSGVQSSALRKPCVYCLSCILFVLVQTLNIVLTHINIGSMHKSVHFAFSQKSFRSAITPCLVPVSSAAVAQRQASS